MFNFLLFDLRKLFAARGFWGTLLVLVIGCAVTGSLMVYSANQSYEDFSVMMDEAQEDNDENGVKTEITIDQDYDNPEIGAMEYNLAQQAIKETFRTSYFVTFLYSMISVLFGIYIALFTGNDFTSGYLKNMLAVRGAKWKWITSKLGTGMIIITFLFAILLSGGIIVEYFVHESLKINWIFIGKIYGLTLMYSMIIAMVTVAILLVTQSKVMAITLNILMNLGIHSSILGLLDRFLRTDMKTYLYSNQFSQFRMDGSMDLVPIIGLGFAYILIIYLVNRIYIKQMDFNFEH